MRKDTEMPDIDGPAEETAVTTTAPARPWWQGTFYDSDARGEDDAGGDWFDRQMARFDYHNKDFSASSRFNKYGKSWATSDDVHQKFHAALVEVARSVGVVRTTYGKADPKNPEKKLLQVMWSDGTKQNSSQSDVVVLSPDIIDKGRTLKPEWSGDQLNDALIGDALLGAGLKRYVSDVARKTIDTTPAGIQKQIATRLWHSGETDNTRRAVCEQFLGFVAYFKATIEYHTGDGFSKELQARLDSTAKNPVWVPPAQPTPPQPPIGGSLNTPGFGIAAPPCNGPTASICAEAWAWNTLHPDAAVTIPMEYQQAYNYLTRRMLETSGEKNSAKRVGCVMKTAQKLWDILPEPEPDQDDDPNKNQNGASPGMFSGAVPNAVNTDIAKQKIDTDNVSQGGGGVDTSIQATITERTCWKQFMDDAAANRNARQHYLKYKAQAAPIIAILKHNLRFRAEDKARFDYGYRSGNLDEDALIRLAVDRRDDAVFMRKEAIGMPSVAFTLIIDESGSMSENGGGTGLARYQAAAILAIALAEALHGQDGIHLAVAGHTDSVQYMHYLCPKGVHKEALGMISARGGTNEAAAIAVAAMRAERWYKGKVNRNIVISLTDGGTNADESARQVEAARKRGVEVYGLGIAGAYNTAHGNKVYGEQRFMVSTDPIKAAVPLASFVSRMATSGK